MLLVLAYLFSNGAAPIDAGAQSTRLLSASVCVDCHDREGHEWAKSRHSQAWSNEIFQAEYKERKQAWCRNCHAPLAEQQRRLSLGDESLAQEGVNCAACHVRAGKIVAARKRSKSPHDTRVVPSFGGAEFCGGCHQFNFPRLHLGEFRDHDREPMQDTLRQYQRFARKTGHTGGCLACHASNGKGHALPGAHSREMLQRAIAVSVCRSQEELELSIVNRGAGHNVPTGDVHRHILLRAWRPNYPERMFEAFFGRRFKVVDGAKQTTWDSTLAPAVRRTFKVAGKTLGGDGPVFVEVSYVYVADEHRSRVAESRRKASIHHQAYDWQTLATCGR